MELYRPKLYVTVNSLICLRKEHGYHKEKAQMHCDIFGQGGKKQLIECTTNLFHKETRDLQEKFHGDVDRKFNPVTLKLYELENYKIKLIIAPFCILALSRVQCKK